MPREELRPQPYLKHMYSYRTFDGLNTMDAENQMTDSELTDLTNIDLSERGSLRRRPGMKNHARKFLWADIQGKTWGQL